MINTKNFRDALAILILIITISVITVSAATDDAGEINTENGIAAPKPCFDFYGSGRTSFATFQRQTGAGITWRLQNNGGAGAETTNFGLAATDFVTPGYFDADNKADLGIWRSGTAGNTQANYWVRGSLTPSFFTVTPWGRHDGTNNPANDAAGFEGDYDGDGRTDPTVVRIISGAFRWFYLRSSNNTFVEVSFGTPATDVVLGGADYDGDGKDEIGVYRIGTGTDTFLAGNSATGAYVRVQPWGEFNTDFVVVGDFVGDGRADFAVYRGFGAAADRVWYILENGTGQATYRQWGISGDLALCGDYTGDGKSDVAIWRPSNQTFYWTTVSGTSIQGAQQLGASGDTPVATLKVF